MTEGQIRKRITASFNEVSHGARLTTGISFLPGDAEDAVKLVLNASAIGKAPKDHLNMQEGSAAFEAWALLIHTHCGFVFNWVRQRTLFLLRRLTTAIMAVSCIGP